MSNPFACFRKLCHPLAFGKCLKIVRRKASGCDGAHQFAPAVAFSRANLVSDRRSFRNDRVRAVRRRHSGAVSGIRAADPEPRRIVSDLFVSSSITDNFVNFGAKTRRMNVAMSIAVTDFESLVRSHTPVRLRVARRFMRSEEDARDALQDAFV